MNDEAMVDRERVTEAAAREAERMERLRRAEFLTPRQVQELYNLDAGTLRNWRGQGKGPAFHKPSEKLVLYRNDDVRAFLASTQLHRQERVGGQR